MLTAALVVGLASTPAIGQAAEPLIEAPSALDEFIDNAVITAPPEEHSPPGVEALISQIAEEYSIPSTTLYNLAYSESRLNPDPPGHNDGGTSAGVVQIQYKQWGITKEQALDPEFALRFAAKKIAKGEEYYWTPCNCYSHVKTFIPNLPRTAELWPNSEPQIGSVALFRYSNGVRHYAYVKSVGEGFVRVTEANKTPCSIGERTVSLSDPFLLGFFMP